MATKASGSLPHIIIPLPAWRVPYLRWLSLLVVIGLLIVWQIAANQPTTFKYQFSSPVAVIIQAYTWLRDGTLVHNLLITLTEIVSGFGLGVSSAFILGYGIAKNRLFAVILNPYLVGLQAVPLIAIAPVLAVIFDTGTLIIAIISALILFFPMLATTIVAIRNIDPNMRDIMRSLAASPWQTFTKLELPAALPTLTAGLKISMVLAVAGAVVGEGVRPEAGLGYLMYAARYAFKSDGVFVAILTLVILSLALYEIVARLERRLLVWRRENR